MMFGELPTENLSAKSLKIRTGQSSEVWNHSKPRIPPSAIQHRNSNAVAILPDVYRVTGVHLCREKELDMLERESMEIE